MPIGTPLRVIRGIRFSAIYNFPVNLKLDIVNFVPSIPSQSEPALGFYFHASNPPMAYK
jgi:hypothetical protein